MNFPFITAHADGHVTAELPNPAVTEDVLRNVQLWKESGVSEDTILKNLRQKTVPSGYIPHNWILGSVSGQLSRRTYCCAGQLITVIRIAT